MWVLVLPAPRLVPARFVEIGYDDFRCTVRASELNHDDADGPCTGDEYLRAFADARLAKRGPFVGVVSDAIVSGDGVKGPSVGEDRDSRYLRIGGLQHEVGLHEIERNLRS